MLLFTGSFEYALDRVRARSNTRSIEYALDRVRARSSTRSTEYALDVRMRDQSEFPSPRLGRVRVGLTFKSDFLPDRQL